jgi:hypothetical protein
MYEIWGSHGSEDVGFGASSSSQKMETVCSTEMLVSTFEAYAAL